MSSRQRRHPPHRHHPHHHNHNSTNPTTLGTHIYSSNGTITSDIQQQLTLQRQLPYVPQHQRTATIAMPRNRDDAITTLATTTSASTAAAVANKSHNNKKTRDVRRFHGAFEGGFSAGYHNTVGSKEGWTPSQWHSSRSGNKRGGNVLQASDPSGVMDSVHRNHLDLRNYMDEEDVRDILGDRRLVRTDTFEKGIGALMGREDASNLDSASAGKHPNSATEHHKTQHEIRRGHVNLFADLQQEEESSLPLRPSATSSKNQQRKPANTTASSLFSLGMDSDVALGERLLRRMGWKGLEAIGNRNALKKRRFPSAAIPMGLIGSNRSLVQSHNVENSQVSIPDVPMPVIPFKDDIHGVGYDSNSMRKIDLLHGSMMDDEHEEAIPANDWGKSQYSLPDSSKRLCMGDLTRDEKRWNSKEKQNNTATQPFARSNLNYGVETQSTTTKPAHTQYDKEIETDDASVPTFIPRKRRKTIGKKNVTTEESSIDFAPLASQSNTAISDSSSIRLANSDFPRSANNEPHIAKAASIHKPSYKGFHLAKNPELHPPSFSSPVVPKEFKELVQLPEQPTGRAALLGLLSVEGRAKLLGEQRIPSSIEQIMNNLTPQQRASVLKSHQKREYFQTEYSQKLQEKLSKAMASRFNVSNDSSPQQQESQSKNQAQQISTSSFVEAAKKQRYGAETRQTLKWQPSMDLKKVLGLEQPHSLKSRKRKREETSSSGDQNRSSWMFSDELFGDALSANAPSSSSQQQIGQIGSQETDTSNMNSDRPSIDLFKSIFEDDDSDDEEEFIAPVPARNANNFRGTTTTSCTSLPENKTSGVSSMDTGFEMFSLPKPAAADHMPEVKEASTPGSDVTESAKVKIRKRTSKNRKRSKRTT